MADYREVKKLYDDFFERYGGMMTNTDVAKELGTSREISLKWLQGRVDGIRVGKRIKWETRLVARAIVNTRGMC